MRQLYLVAVNEILHRFVQRAYILWVFKYFHESLYLKEWRHFYLALRIQILGNTSPVNKNFKDVLFLRFFDRGFAIRPACPVVASHVPTATVKYTCGFERYPFYFTESQKAQNVKERFKEYESVYMRSWMTLKTRCNVCVSDKRKKKKKGGRRKKKIRWHFKVVVTYR